MRELRVYESRDINEIHTVLKHPEIYDCISCDNSPCLSDFTAPLDDSTRYVVGSINGEIIAVTVYHIKNNKQYCHTQVLPQYRAEYAKEYGEQAIKLKGTRQLYAEIPDNYPNVLAFAHVFGFEVVDKIDVGYVKNNIPYKVNVLKLKEA